MNASRKTTPQNESVTIDRAISALDWEEIFDRSIEHPSTWEDQRLGEDPIFLFDEWQFDDRLDHERFIYRAERAQQIADCSAFTEEEKIVKLKELSQLVFGSAPSFEDEDVLILGVAEEIDYLVDWITN